MERLTKRDENGVVKYAIDCPNGCEYFFPGTIGEGPNCNHGCEADAMCKLADYEDAEEQGLLLRLPCKAGDTVYDVYCGKIYTRIARGILLRNEKIWIQDGNGSDIGVWGGTVFATESEAQETLERMVE